VSAATPNPEPEPSASGWLASLHRADASLYATIASSSTPALDGPIALISDAANLSKPWVASAAALALFGGQRGRRAAFYGIASVTVASTVVNLAIKPLSSRRRPDRVAAGVIAARHAALAIPASLVAYSRVHTGVHYPGDVVAGSLIGVALAKLTCAALDRLRS